MPAKPPKPGRRRRLLPGLLALGLGALGLHGLAWTWLTGALAVGFSDWATMRRLEGWSIAHDPPTRGGWPLAAELVLPALRVEGRGTALAEAVALDSARVVLRIAPAAPDRLVIAAQGPQRLTLGALDMPFAAARIEARVPLQPGPAPRGAEIEAEALRAALPAGPFEARRARLSLAAGEAAGEQVLRIDLLAEGLRLPPSPDPALAAFGPEVGAAALTAIVTGSLAGPASAARARAWRDAGGVAELRSLSLRWGPLEGEAQLRLGLDGALQPSGTGMLRIADAPAALAAMERAGMITPGAARTARGVAALAARVPPEGGAPQVELPLALAEGRLSVARIPLLQVPRIAWPGMAPGR